MFYDYPSFETELRNLLTVALLDELKFLGCPDFARQDNREELLGSLPFPDKALRTGTALERGENKLGLQGDFGCVVERRIRIETNFTSPWWLNATSKPNVGIFHPQPSTSSASRASAGSTRGLPGEPMNTPLFEHMACRTFIHAALQQYGSNLPVQNALAFLVRKEPYAANRYFVTSHLVVTHCYSPQSSEHVRDDLKFDNWRKP